MLRYCTNCIMPDTKPDLKFDEEGVCSACRHFQRRRQVDWDKRLSELKTILDRYRCKDGSNYDCLVPVSGGKDSTYQVIRMLEMGMNPLCVTGTTDQLSDLGRYNIENLKRLGVDYVEYSSNPNIRAKINRIALRQVGDIAWPEHVTIFTFPVRVAVQFNIPLLIWGENSQDEYGGPATAANNQCLTRRWLEEFGGLLGMRVSDLIGQEGIEKHHLIPFTYPTDEELKRVGVTGLFLGYFMPWDSLQNAVIAQAHGFRSYHKCVEGAMYNFENLDNIQMGIHDYFKFLKYGFGRATDHACMAVRRGRLSRSDAIKIVSMHDGKFPWEYLGYPLQTILDKIDIPLDEFVKICDRFTNKRIFQCDARGNLIKDRKGNLTKLNYDNVVPAKEQSGAV